MRILLSEAIGDFDLAAALKDISPQRREQALKFKYEQGQRLCVLAYQLLKQGLREEFGMTENPVFTYNEHGKPSIVGHPDIYFNLSHCKEAAVCAISTQPIGIDVESIREYKESLAKYTMNESELELIQQSDCPAREFIRLWTMKESALKLLGTGISDDLKTVLTTHPDIRFTTHIASKYVYTWAVNDISSGKNILK